MKSVYRIMNERYVDKMVNVIWRGNRDYYKNIKKGILLEGGNKEVLKDVLLDELLVINSIGNSNALLELNPISFKSALSNKSIVGNSKAAVSDKCLYHYAYIGEYLEKYYHDGVLDIEKVKQDCLEKEYYIDLSGSIRESIESKGVYDYKLVNNLELLKVYKGAQSVEVCDEAKSIYVTLEYRDWGYDVTKMGYRYDAYRYNPKNWIDDKNAINATLKQIKEIEKTNKAPKDIDVESFLIWLGGELDGVYAENYIKLYDRIALGGVRWYQQAEKHIEKLGLFDRYEGYGINIIKKRIDPVANIHDVAMSINEKYYIGYDYENDRDIYDLYNERYIPWED